MQTTIAVLALAALSPGGACLTAYALAAAALWALSPPKKQPEKTQQREQPA